MSNTQEKTGKEARGNDRRLQPATLTSAALAVALSVVCLLLFRGTTSIASAFVIPALLAIFGETGGRGTADDRARGTANERDPGTAVGYDRAYLPLAAGGLLAATLLFFPTQAVFVLGYVLLSFALRFLFPAAGRTTAKGNRRKGTPANGRALLPRAAAAALYALCATAILYLGIRLTEAIYGIPLHGMMLRLAGGDLLRYAGILFVEGVLVAAANLFFLKGLASRVRAVLFPRSQLGFEERNKKDGID